MFKKIWVGIFRNSKIDRILLLSVDAMFRDEVFNVLKDEDAIPVNTNNLGEFKSDSLILDESYYIDLDKIKKKHFLDTFAENVLEDRCMALENEVLRFGRGNRIEIEADKEVPKFLMTESESTIMFLPIKTRGIIRKQSIFDLNFLKNLSTGNQKAIYKVNLGVPFPVSICATYDRINQRLYVINNEDFESIIGTFDAQQKKAAKHLHLFQNGELTLGLEKYKVNFQDFPNIKTDILESRRLTKRLGMYDAKKNEFSIKKMKKAMKKLPKELQIKFDDTEKLIEVNMHNKKTFIGILHNTIVERILSGEIEIL